MRYSDYFNFGSGPEMKTKSRNVPGRWISSAGGTVAYNVVSDGVKNSGANNSFDAIMAGHDATTKAYTNTLKSIYDSYGQYAKDYEGQVQPIIDSLGGDIKGMEGYITDYNKLLQENKGTFLDGIVLDPNADRTRAEYTGAISNQYDNARNDLNKRQISQGLNPYENKGASRDLALSRAKDLGLASGRAYTDWRAGHNRDVKDQQNATSTYMGLQNNTLDAQGKVMTARAGIGNLYGNILNSKIAAGKDRAKGYESLTSLAEARRQEALGLGKQQQANARQNADIKQQLSAKLTSGDKYLATAKSPDTTSLFLATR